MTAMTPAPHALARAHGAQGRHRREDPRRRRREKFLVVLVLVAAFVVTVVLVGLQWLGSQATAAALPAQTSHSFRARC
jgi:cell division septal protein FtsQ